MYVVFCSYFWTNLYRSAVSSVMASDLNGAGRGLNFVVVNPETKEVVRVARFDTFASGLSSETPTFKKLLYGKASCLSYFLFFPFPSLNLSHFFVPLFSTLFVPRPLPHKSS